MPSVESGSDAAARDQMVVGALERCCSSSEQSYPQFLASFSHLTGSGGLGNAASGLDSLPGQTERPGECRRRRGAGGGEGEGGPRGSTLPADQEEVMLGDGAAAGTFGNGDIPPGAILKVNNFWAVGNLSQEEEECPPDSPGAVDILPGEVEEEAPAYLPSFCRRTRLEMSSTARGQDTRGPQASPQASPQDMSESEEVTPFSLDQNFDYDRVVLSHTFRPLPRRSPDSP